MLSAQGRQDDFGKGSASFDLQISCAPRAIQELGRYTKSALSNAALHSCCAKSYLLSARLSKKLAQFVFC